VKRFLPNLEATRLQIAIKSCLAIILYLGIALWLDWKPSFGVILIVVMQRAAVGITYKKGLLYIAGTLTGAAAGVIMVSLFAHDRAAFIVGMAVLTGIGVYCMIGSRNAYAWLIFIVTVGLVGWLSAESTSSTFDLAVMRASTICLAVAISFAVHGILWPVLAGRIFERQLRAFPEACRELVRLTNRTLTDEKPDLEAVRQAEATQLEMVKELRSMLEAASSDTRRFRRFHAGYEQLVDQLSDLLVAIHTLRGGITSCPDVAARESLKRISGSLRERLATIEGEMGELARDLSRPRDGTSSSHVSGWGDWPEPRHLGRIDTGFAAMIAANARDLASQVSTVRATISRVEDPGVVRAPRVAPPRERFSLKSARFRRALGGGLVVLLSAWLFIVTQWPEFQLSLVFTAVAIGLTGLMPAVNAMVGRQLLLSLVVGPAIAAPLYLGIMPHIDQYAQLIPWLCVAFLPLLYLQTSKNPRTMKMLLFSSIFLAALLMLDEERQSYSFSSFMTMWFGLAGGFGIALPMLALLSPELPEREFWKQVRSFFAGGGRFMQDLEKRPKEPPAPAVWRGPLKQVQMWSALIDYKRVAGPDRRKTQALVESIEHVAIYLATAGHARRGPVAAVVEPLREPLHRLHHVCVDSFQLLASSVTDLKPVPEIADTARLIRDIESKGGDICRSLPGDDDAHASALSLMSGAARLHALADLLHDCRDRANALDWEAWNRSHF